MKPTTEKIVILLTAFVLFVAGIWALSMDRGQGRTILLWCVVGAMLAIAVRQTAVRMRKKK